MKLLKVPYDDAAQILALFEPSTELSELAKTHTSPFNLITNAVEQELFSDAVTYLAHALPVRESVWWATCCASARSDWNSVENEAIQSAKAWVHVPDETNRRQAEDSANSAGLDSGAGWAAQAAFWSGGSMTAPSDPIVPPPQYLYAQATAGSINLTAVLPEGEQAKQRYELFIKMGLDIAQGGNGTIAGIEALEA
ncbi:DUF6931 family protein [Vibrio aestuarianus]|uniref:DUF6931 family protein n=1 Tax=Vibrio aestuarianus TaxID=28171 RepID=UPI0021C4A976|nr:Twin-arginine translocation pathway signal [Vibrio aestuarianus]MDE1211885.1 Twin-arginine translocation pathway signal [Vibrio aestuarianus]MDE1255033.1 Twin-arginine translocation pathway signal [Vibrio aestuarianus]MDE1319861.1 Twin-arginine translocation pathway signal [Vibrio aestuarianus]CAH8187439.1 Twin-arginine translocation pathway signal [Vibrio aestuarianus]